MDKHELTIKLLDDLHDKILSNIDRKAQGIFDRARDEISMVARLIEQDIPKELQQYTTEIIGEEVFTRLYDAVFEKLKKGADYGLEGRTKARRE